MYQPPVYLSAITVLGVLGILGLTCVVLYRGARGAGSRRAGLLAAGAAVPLAAWFTISAVIAGRGGYHTKLGQQPPWLPIATVAVLLALLAATRIPAVARALATPDTVRALGLPHIPRVAGVTFLITMALGHLPALFALPAGLGDIAVGLSAPMITRGAGHRRAVWFNVLGTVDLVVALGLGAVTAFQFIPGVAPNDAIAEFPLALIPTVAVPVLLAAHVVSLIKLAAGTDSSDVSAGPLTVAAVDS